MKRILLSLGGALAALLPITADAKDACPAGKQVYEFKPTGKMLKPGTPVMKAGKAAYIKIDGIDGESCDTNWGRGDIIKSEQGVYIKLGNGIEGECTVGPKGAKVYAAEAHCKK